MESREGLGFREMSPRVFSPPPSVRSSTDFDSPSPPDSPVGRYFSAANGSAPRVSAADDGGSSSPVAYVNVNVSSRASNSSSLDSSKQAEREQAEERERRYQRQMQRRKRNQKQQKQQRQQGGENAVPSTLEGLGKKKKALGTECLNSLTGMLKAHCEAAF